MSEAAIDGRQGFGRLPRLHLLELEDQTWYPATWRDLATDFLRFAERRLGLHRHVVPVLERVLLESGTRRIVDLCSGGAGVVPELAAALRERGLDVHWTLTDLYPNIEAMAEAEHLGGGRISAALEPVDARSVPAELTGLRTFFNAFHHFRPADGRAILGSAAEAGEPIAILEIPERSVASLLRFLPVPLAVLAVTPLMRPLSGRRLLFTYLIPVVPLTCLWDGLVSQLRAYRPGELLAMGEAAAPDYRWEAGTHRAPGVPGRLTYLLGWPG